MLRGQLGWRAYWRSVLGFDIEAVFSLDDPLPGLAELTLLAYLYFKRGF